jgi:predicted membrane protein
METSANPTDQADHHEPFATDADSFQRASALDGLKIQVGSRRFRRGRVTAAMSGVTIDLRQATLAPEGATIDVRAILSGIDILVPRGWCVQCDVDVFCGATDAERCAPPWADDAPRLRVVGKVVAGALCVR